MTMPSDVGVIDLMMGIPEGHKKDWYGFLRKGFMDDESKDMEFPAQYMFKDVPEDIDEDADPVAVVLGEMDHFGIEQGDARRGLRAAATIHAGRRRTTPTASSARYEVDPNKGMEGVRDLVKALRDVRHQGGHRVPRGHDRRRCRSTTSASIPLYAKCIELDIPIFITTGVPGPRVPMLCQKTELLDEVCWFFPELQVRDAPRRRAVGRRWP